MPATSKDKTRVTYRDAGVDIDAGNALVARGDGVLGGDVDRDLGDLVEAVGSLRAAHKRGHGKQRQGDARNS